MTDVEKLKKALEHLKEIVNLGIDISPLYYSQFQVVIGAVQYQIWLRENKCQ